MLPSTSYGPVFPGIPHKSKDKKSVDNSQVVPGNKPHLSPLGPVAALQDTGSASNLNGADETRGECLKGIYALAHCYELGLKKDVYDYVPFL